MPFRRPIKPAYIRRLVRYVDAVRGGERVSDVTDPRGSYKVVIEPLSEEDGGGFLATVPEHPGCMSDGGTRAEALANVEGAIATWIHCDRKAGRAIPEPKSGPRSSNGGLPPGRRRGEPTCLASVEKRL